MPVSTVAVGTPYLEVFLSESLDPWNPQFPALHQVLDSHSRIWKKRSYTVAQQGCLIAVSTWMPVATVAVGTAHLEVFLSASLDPGNPQFPALHQVLDSHSRIWKKRSYTVAQHGCLFAVSVWMPVAAVAVGTAHLEVFLSASLEPGNPQFPALHQVLDFQTTRKHLKAESSELS
ncbi:uncharacterized protein LOC143270520 [Peromyscus maniculatus bairdii]|uniref:uncharacterized protein LOC143270520 n=1 Tax=Peromyscus maniculatus bairdii TaxID=230844 RepID=UPI003FD5C180